MKKLILILVAIVIANSVFSFSPPTLYSPSNGGSTYSSATLDWYTISGINYGTDQFEFQIASDNAFSEIVFTDIETSINSSSSNEDTKEYVENLRFGEAYYWRVDCL